MTEIESSPRLYYLVFAALLTLLALTVAVAQVDLGPLNIVAALAVAAAKTFLIAIYFMHLQTARNTVRVFAVIGVMWLIMLLGLLLNDYVTRRAIPEITSHQSVRAYSAILKTFCQDFPHSTETELGVDRHQAHGASPDARLGDERSHRDAGSPVANARGRAINWTGNEIVMRRTADICQ